MLYIWGHSFELDRNNNWGHMEEICRRLSSNNSLWHANNIELYDYVYAYKHLQYSADGHLIRNPSLLTIWLDADSKLYAVRSSETIRIN